jgi:hypothetical protein
VIWAVPALVIGAVLRLLLLSYIPYAYWGSDSRSYYSFAHQLLDQGVVNLEEKRRYLYPLFLVPISLLPGEPLRWLAWVQHALGLATLIPLAYVVRRTLVHWRWWIVPVTVAWAGMPMVLWYEHELLGETLFFSLIVCTIAGWVAWAEEARLARAHRLFWCFFIPLALFILTKPSGRFVLPGLCVGLMLLKAWRRLAWTHWTALFLLLVVMLTMGSKKQGAWLLYVATFPLTSLDSPSHAEYKAEIRDMVEPLRRELDTYYLRDDAPFAFLESPDEQDVRPLWKALNADTDKRSRLYLDLALEGIRARPDLFLYLGLQRVVASANLSEFKDSRFAGDYYAVRFRDDYEDAIEDLARGRRTSVLTAFAVHEPLPPWEEFRARLAPRPNSLAARVVINWVRGYERVADVVRMPRSEKLNERGIGRARPTLLGAWLLLGMLLSLLPRYRATLGVWMLVSVSYLVGVFLVSQPNPRYFGPAWAMLLPLFALPADALLRALRLPCRTRVDAPCSAVDVEFSHAVLKGESIDSTQSQARRTDPAPVSPRARTSCASSSKPRCFE